MRNTPLANANNKDLEFSLNHRGAQLFLLTEIVTDPDLPIVQPTVCNDPSNI